MSHTSVKELNRIVEELSQSTSRADRAFVMRAEAAAEDLLLQRTAIYNYVSEYELRRNAPTAGGYVYIDTLRRYIEVTKFTYHEVLARIASFARAERRKEPGAHDVHIIGPPPEFFAYVVRAREDTGAGTGKDTSKDLSTGAGKSSGRTSRAIQASVFFSWAPIVAMHCAISPRAEVDPELCAPLYGLVVAATAPPIVITSLDSVCGMLSAIKVHPPIMGEKLRKYMERVEGGAGVTPITERQFKFLAQSRGYYKPKDISMNHAPRAHRACVLARGFIYFIAHDPYDGYVKIGMSNNPSARLAQLQTGNPRRLRIMRTVECNDMRRCEQKMHQMYAHARRCGEWFELTEAEAIECAASAEADMKRK